MGLFAEMVTSVQTPYVWTTHRVDCICRSLPGHLHFHHSGALCIGEGCLTHYIFNRSRFEHELAAQR